jgi:Lipase (class 3)
VCVCVCMCECTYIYIYIYVCVFVWLHFKSVHVMRLFGLTFVFRVTASVGHSLGGAYASLVYYLLERDRHFDPDTAHGVLGRVPIECVTFGAPVITHSHESEESLRVFVDSFAPLANIHHFVHDCDVVPRLLGGKLHRSVIQSSGDMSETKHYIPLGRFYFLHGDGSYISVFDTSSPPLLEQVLDMPAALVYGFKVSKVLPGGCEKLRARLVDTQEKERGREYIARVQDFEREGNARECRVLACICVKRCSCENL